MNKVSWAIQSNLTKEEYHKELKEALESLNVPYEEFKLIPFSIMDGTEYVKAKDPIWYGSTSLAKQVGNQKGYFYGDFSISTCVKHWRELMLNADGKPAQYFTLDTEEKMFIRPNTCEKSFMGSLYSKADISKFTVNSDWDGWVWVAPPKDILVEWRVFMVGGKAVASSMYREDGKMVHEEGAPDDVLDLALEAYCAWAPHPVCVIDFCETDKGLFILEANYFNSSGFYKANVYNIVKAVSEWYSAQ